MNAVPPSPLPEGSGGRDPSPRVGIVIVHYRGQEDTLECLESLRRLRYSNVDIVLVDNASHDDTPALVASAFPEVFLVENAANLGFSGGNNVGIEAARARGAEYLFLLNNDTVVDPDLLEPLVALLQSDATIGVTGPLMFYHAEPDTIWSGGGRVDAVGSVMQIGQNERADAVREPYEVDYIVGCGLMIGASVLDRIGTLDESYFLYYEETDLCARARAAGLRIVCQPAARLWHKVSRSTGADSDLTLYYMWRNRLLYVSRHGSRASLARALADCLRLALVWTLQRKARRRVLLRAAGDFLRGRFGKADFLSA